MPTPRDGLPTGLQKGVDILKELHHNLTGMGLPAFAFDLPEGGGKIRLEPDFTTEDGKYISRSGTPLPYL